MHVASVLFVSIVGNKDDDPTKKVVLTQDAKRFAEQSGIELFETSAKDNINVDEVCFLSLRRRSQGTTISDCIISMRSKI